MILSWVVPLNPYGSAQGHAFAGKPRNVEIDPVTQSGLILVYWISWVATIVLLYICLFWCWIIIHICWPHFFWFWDIWINHTSKRLLTFLISWSPANFSDRYERCDWRPVSNPCNEASLEHWCHRGWHGACWAIGIGRTTRCPNKDPYMISRIPECCRSWYGSQWMYYTYSTTSRFLTRGNHIFLLNGRTREHERETLFVKMI